MCSDKEIIGDLALEIKEAIYQPSLKTAEEWEEVLAQVKAKQPNFHFNEIREYSREVKPISDKEKLHKQLMTAEPRWFVKPVVSIYRWWHSKSEDDRQCLIDVVGFLCLVVLGFSIVALLFCI